MFLLSKVKRENKERMENTRKKKGKVRQRAAESTETKKITEKKKTGLGKVDTGTWWTADSAGGTALSCGGGGERAVGGRRWRRLGGEVVLLVPTPSGSRTALKNLKTHLTGQKHSVPIEEPTQYVYQDYHTPVSVPFSELGPPLPLPQASVSLPP